MSIHSDSNHGDIPIVDNSNICTEDNIQKCISLERYQLLLQERNTLKEEIDSISISISNSKIVIDLTTRNQELETCIDELNTIINKLKTEKRTLEDVILKQEEYILEIEKRTDTRKETIKRQEAMVEELNQTIDGYKKKIANMKLSYAENENKEISELRNKVGYFENILELKDSKLEALYKRYYLLQDKYLKFTAQKRIQPQEELLKQAKEMKIMKIVRRNNDLNTINNNIVYKKNYSVKVIRGEHKKSCDTVLPNIKPVLSDSWKSGDELNEQEDNE